MSKICSKCGVEKPLEHFHKNKRTKDGRVSACAVCINKKTREDYAVKVSTQNNQICLDEKYCFGCNTTKPVDEWPLNKSRKDGLGTQCSECISVSAAIYRQRLKSSKTKSVQEKKYCPVCDTTKNSVLFSKSASRKDGLSWQCKDCASLKNRQNTESKLEARCLLRETCIAQHKLKYCASCDTELPYSWFSADRYASDGTNSACKNCVKNYYTENLARILDSSAQWREDNLDRIRSYQSVYEKKIRSRGAHRTIALDTGDFITKEILERRDGGNCYYCGVVLDFSSYSFKTHPDNHAHLEHKTPVIRGGLHVLDNVVLACRRCNLSKGSKTEQEFKDWLGIKKGGSRNESSSH